MTTPYTPSDTYHPTPNHPDDGDLSNATKLAEALEEHADNIFWLYSRTMRGTLALMRLVDGAVDDLFYVKDTAHPGWFQLRHPGVVIVESFDIYLSTTMGAGWYWFRCDYPVENKVIETGELYSSACDLDNANASMSYVSLLTSGTIEIDGLAVGDEIEFTIGPFEVYAEGAYGGFLFEVVDDATGGTCLATSHAKAASPALLTFGFRYVKAGVTTDTIQLNPQIAGDGDPFHAVAAIGAKRFLGTYRVVRP